MRFLVTGAAGFIGSNFCRLVLATSQHEVVGFDSMTYAANFQSISDLLGRRMTFVEGEINDVPLLEKHMRNVDVVVHFAAESHNDLSIANPDAFVHSNYLGTFNVVKLATKLAKRLHHVSTDEVFGDLDLNETTEFTEESNYKPSSPYSATKAGSDMLVRSWARTFGLRATISNCSNNYGPRQHAEKFIPRQITEVLMGRTMKLYGNGSNVRDWIHVEDHARGVLKIIEKGVVGETYLIGGRCQMSNIQVALQLAKILQVPREKIEFVTDRPGHDLRYAINPSKFERLIGWGEKGPVPFMVGLKDTVEWYADNSSWWSSQKAEVESRYRSE